MQEDRREEIRDPFSVLDRRLASGEIDRAQYDELKAVLLSGRSSRQRRGTSSFGRSGLVILITLGVIVAFTITAMAVTYGPWRTADGGVWPWGGCCNWGGQGGMGGGMMGGEGGGLGPNSVAIVNYAYSPAEITVSAGTTVTWLNMDGVMHTVSFGEHGNDHQVEAMDSGPMYHMNSWSYTFNDPGVYEYHCDPHPYMTGQVLVEG